MLATQYSVIIPPKEITPEKIFSISSYLKIYKLAKDIYIVRDNEAWAANSMLIEMSLAAWPRSLNNIDMFLEKHNYSYTQIKWVIPGHPAPYPATGFEFSPDLLQHTISLLGQINEKWDYILEESFGVKSAPTITLEQAQNLITDLVNAMTSENFLQEIDQVISDVDGKELNANQKEKTTNGFAPLTYVYNGKAWF